MSDKQEIRVDVVGSVDPKLQRDVDGLTQRVKASFVDANKDIQNLGRTGMGQAGSLGQPPDKDILDRYTVKQQMLKNAIDQYGGMGAGERRNYSSQIKSLMRQVGAEPEEAARKLIYETSDAIEAARGIGGARGQRAISATNRWAESESERVAGMQADSDMILGRAKELMGEGGGKGGRMLPAYIGTVINSLGNLGVMGAGLYHAEKTMWDINSPQAMANQMIAKDIYETRTITKGLAGTIGSVGGGIVGAIAGGGAGSLVGSYLGGQIMAPIGEMVATFLTASKEAQQKLFNTIFGKAQGNVGVFNAVQSLEYTLAARGGGGMNFRGFGAKYGLSPTEARQLGTQYMEASGGGDEGTFRDLIEYGRSHRLDMGSVMGLSRLSRFTGVSMGGGERDKMEAVMSAMGMNDATRQEFIQRFGGGFNQAAGVLSGPEDIYRAGWSVNMMPEAFYGAGNIRPGSFATTNEGVQQIQGVYSALATPANDAQRAFMFTAFRRAHPEEGFKSTMLRMREGMFGDGNLSAIMGNIPPELRQEYILALTEGKNVNVGLTRDMMKSASTEGGWSDFVGRWNDVEAQAREQGLYGDAKQKFVSDKMVPLSERGQSTIAEEQAESGRKIQGFMTNLAVEHEKWLNYVVSTKEAQKEMSEILTGVRDEVMKVLWDNDAPLAAAVAGHFQKSGPQVPFFGGSASDFQAAQEAQSQDIQMPPGMMPIKNRSGRIVGQMKFSIVMDDSTDGGSKKLGR